MQKYKNKKIKSLNKKKKIQNKTKFQRFNFNDWCMI